MKVMIYRYPHGYFSGGIIFTDIMPSITISAFDGNNFIIEVDEEENINNETPIAHLFPLGDGRYAMNAPNGIACTLTGAHHYAGNITHPRQGFREMGILEVYEKIEDKDSE